MDFKKVYEGWKNTLLPEESKKEVITKTSQYRTAICEGCLKHSKYHTTIRPDDHCTDCGCTLRAKTRCLSCECPLEKWGPVEVKFENDEKS